MILGAGPFQVPAIRTAAQLGCHVITVDYLPGNVGHRISQEFVNCSTVDREGVLAEAKRLTIDGIMTMASDVALPTVAFVAAELGLPGPGVPVVETFTDKSRFHEFQARYRLSHPVFDAATTIDEIDWSRFGAFSSVIIKPADTSGSRGICRVKPDDEVARQRAFEAAKTFSRSGIVCVEQFVDGRDVTAEGFLFSNNDPVIAFTEKFTRGCAVVGHRLPGVLSERQQCLAEEAVCTAFDAAGYHEGPFDADLRINGEQVTILEMTPRLGGNGCPLLVNAYTGVNPVEQTIRQALGERLERPHLSEPEGGCGSTIIGSEITGILQSIQPFAQIQQILPYVREGIWAVKPEQQVNEFRHGGDLLGFAIFECDSAADFHQKCAAIRRAAAIKVVPSE